ncbi:NAD(P)-binding domain-containing protein [Facklamia sp. P9177]|uniref:NAD(P)-binding domain-containing protein n=1 Tax=Facklamia sp. P9177 TaxID=3421945 RepID=UPI003D170C48
MDQTLKVGFIGLGVMGQSMARHILRAGYPLYVYNRTRSKANQLVEEEAFGVLFDENYTLNQAIRDFLEKKDSKQVDPIDTDNLYEISVEKFTDQVLTFYKQVCERYIEEETGLFDRVFSKVKNVIREIVIGGKI